MVNSGKVPSYSLLTKWNFLMPSLCLLCEPQQLWNSVYTKEAKTRGDAVVAHSSGSSASDSPANSDEAVAGMA